VDDTDASFIKEDGKQGTCVNITLLGFGKPGNGTRIKFYNKDTDVKSTWPGTCKRWCYFVPSDSDVLTQVIEGKYLGHMILY